MKKTQKTSAILGAAWGCYFVNVCAMVLCLSACGSAPPSSPLTHVLPEVQTLNPGDVIKISFPGAQNLDTTQQIRRDGRINLYMIGDFKAVGKTGAELERELMNVYSGKASPKEIQVRVVSRAKG